MNPLTPKPITPDTTSMACRSRLGTRYTDGTHDFTLVAYDIRHEDTAIPVFVADSDLDVLRSEYEWVVDGSVALHYARDLVGDDEALQVTHDNPVRADRARAAAVRRYNEPPCDTGDLFRVLAFSDLTTAAEVSAFSIWVEAELALREAEAVRYRAARRRFDVLDHLVRLMDGQEEAARLIGRDPLTMGWGVHKRPELP